jgi:predicted secreted hydrolase
LRSVIVPELADQENRSHLVKNLFYWEGAVRIETAEGGRIGRGYVELVGYGTRSRPAI